MKTPAEHASAQKLKFDIDGCVVAAGQLHYKPNFACGLLKFNYFNFDAVLDRISNVLPSGIIGKRLGGAGLGDASLGFHSQGISRENVEPRVLPDR